MNVPGHEPACPCRWCRSENIYLRLPSGRYVNFTRHLAGGSPFEDTPHSVSPELFKKWRAEGKVQDAEPPAPKGRITPRSKRR